MKAMEKNGVILEYEMKLTELESKTSVKFFMDITTTVESYETVLEQLKSYSSLREIYTTTGECRILQDCDASSWRAICEKLQRVQEMILEDFPEKMALSFSAGLCFSEKGVNEEMMKNGNCTEMVISCEHPKKGPITIRFTGEKSSEEDGQEIYTGYYQILSGIHILHE